MSNTENIESVKVEFVIRTTDKRDFKINDAILIGDVRYMVSYVQREQNDINNGIFRNKVRPIQYLSVFR